jgi:hypothetical protein
MGDLNAAITSLLIALFSTKGAALGLAGLILLAAIGILVGVYFTRVIPIRKAVQRRIVDFPRTVEPSALEPLSAMMSQPGKQSFNLERAWAAFRSALLLTPDGQLRSGAPAWTVFNVVTSETQVLGWWSNLFVAIGLIFTFLGVVAALSEATNVLGTGSNTAVMQAALSGLLTITATKFWTSIAGILASVILRICERRWSSRIDEAVEDLCEIIDVRIPPVSPGMLAGEQLNEMKRQTEVLAEIRDALARDALARDALAAPQPRARAS